MQDIEVGKVYRTLWEPSGLFRVAVITGSRAIGHYVGDHPKGYKDGQVGAYYAGELLETTQEVMNDA